LGIYKKLSLEIAKIPFSRLNFHVSNSKFIRIPNPVNPEKKKSSLAVLSIESALAFAQRQK